MKSIRIKYIHILAMAGVAFMLLQLSMFCLASGSAKPRCTLVNAGGDENKVSDFIDNVNYLIDSELPGVFLQGFLDKSKSGNDITVYIDIPAYRELKQRDKQKVMQIALSQVKNSDISASNKNKLYNFIAGEDATISALVRELSTDTKPDFVKASSFLRPFRGALGVALGIIALVIFIFLGLMIMIDLAYLAIPVFQITLTDPTKDVKPFFVSVEAYKALKTAESTDKAVNTVSVYMKMKAGQIVVLAILLLYLISGQIFDLIASVMDYFSGLLG